MTACGLGRHIYHRSNYPSQPIFREIREPTNDHIGGSHLAFALSLPFLGSEIFCPNAQNDRE